MRFDKEGKEAPVLEKPCKHCGVVAGAFVKVKYSGKSEYNIDDEDDGFDNYEFYEYADWYTSKTKYCRNCRKPIGKDTKQ